MTKQNVGVLKDAREALTYVKDSGYIVDSDGRVIADYDALSGFFHVRGLAGIARDETEALNMAAAFKAGEWAS